MKYFFLLLAFTSNAWASLPLCGEHQLEREHPGLVWKKFIEIGVRSRFADVDSLICVGFISGSPVAERVTYRDELEQSLISRSVEELEQFQVLITSQDLPRGIATVVRGGNLVSLKIAKVVLDEERGISTYPVAVRFHRSLAKGTSIDIREIELEGKIDFNEDEVWAMKDQQIFNQLRLYISSLPPRMEQIILKQDEVTKVSFFTSQLQRVRDLTE
jgi:hypothetical protein